MSSQGVIAAQGFAPSGDSWEFRYRPEGHGGRHHIELLVNGSMREQGSGFDIPATTELGFCGGLTPGSGDFYLFGLTTSRVATVRAESPSEEEASVVATAPVPGATADDGSSLRSFVLIRRPVENVSALVGLDRQGEVVQRIDL